MFDDFGEGEDGSVVEVHSIVSGEIEMSTRSAF